MTRAIATRPVTADRIRRRFVVSGLVQGVGFRPFVYVTAAELGLSGSVRNDANGVVAEVEGAPAAVAAFESALRHSPPQLAVVERIDADAQPCQGGTGFEIGSTDAASGGQTLASPDVAPCPDCLAELADPSNRRYRHPFISCTNCGPRFSIITELPYDRPRTTMAAFEMCARCRSEYTDPSDRRFHAQPIACPQCGPRLEFFGDFPGGEPILRGEPALTQARARLAAGDILAVKGIGGYHLVADAGDDRAVRTLRERKRRGDKPFAVMVADLDAARALVEVDEVEAAELSGWQRPIVLLRRLRPGACGPRLSGAVAPGTNELGLMLPYSPIHHLLFGLPGDPPGPTALVMTSGNLGGEPIAYTDEDARVRLGPLVDGWLSHDRAIHVPGDDSVVRVVDGEVQPIRRSRGYAPMPVALPFAVGPTLAVGADLKNVCAVASGRYAWLSQHIGDMDDVATLDAFGRAEAHMERLTGITPRLLVADRHPAYRSAGWARMNAGTREVRTVQHHHGHVAAVMAEHGLDGASPVIGVAFDGTGFGSDGAVWGGEVLLADYRGFHRFAHLAYVPMLGGEASIRRPYRMALSHLHAAGVEWNPALPPVRACPAMEQHVLERQLNSGFGAVPTSSMGRLFDAVAALCGVRATVDYEAQAAIEFEAQAAIEFEAQAAIEFEDAASSAAAYRFAWREHCPPVGALIADPAPLIRSVAADVLAGVPTSLISARFHRAVSELVVEFARRARAGTGLDTVALTGGVFQNARLLSSTRTALRAEGFRVLTHRRVPPNDGGLALGQIVVAAAMNRPVTSRIGEAEGDRSCV